MQGRLGLNLVCVAQTQDAGLGGWGRDTLQREVQSVQRQDLALSTKYLSQALFSMLKIKEGA